jgi:hypothetical protein
VGHAGEMRSQSALTPWGAVAAHPGRRRLCAAWQRASATERVPGVGRCAHGPRPMHDCPMPSGPYAACAQAHPLLLALDRAATAPRRCAARARGRGHLAPQALDAAKRRRGRQGPRRERLQVRGHTRHQAVTGGQRASRAPGQGHRLWHSPQTVPHPRAPHVLGQKRPPAGRVARAAGPVSRPVAPTQWGHAPGGDAAGRRDQCPLLAPTARGLRWAPPGQLDVTRHPQRGAPCCCQGLFDDGWHRGDHDVVHREAEGAVERAWEALTLEHLPGVRQVASMVPLLGMAQWDIPPSHQVRHNPGSRGWPKIFQCREIIRTLPSRPVP